MSSKNVSRTKLPVDVIMDNLDEMSVSPGVSELYDSSNHSLQPVCSQSRDSECLSARGRCRSCGKGRDIDFTPDKKNNNAYYIVPDNAGVIGMRSQTFFDLAANGSAEELPLSNDNNAHDCEVMVAVAPYYVKFGSMCYEKCVLTFSNRHIRMEDSSVREKSHQCFEWQIYDIMKIGCQPCESVDVKAVIVNLHFKFTDSKVCGACISIPETVELEFVVDDCQWSKKQEEITSLDLKYEAAWRIITRMHSSPGAFEDIIYPEGDPDAVIISWRDVELLQPRTFINDTIIDFYMKYIFNEIIVEEQHRFHFFNTFFFRKLAGLDQDSSRDWEGKEAFRRVRKWTRNLNLFEKDYIFIPVNFSLHWSLIIICHPGKVAELREKDMDYSVDMPCILHMDSLQGSHRGMDILIRSYLCEEWKVRHNNLDANISMKDLNWPFIALQLPQQENLFDCGLFMLHYAEVFLELVSSSRFHGTRYSDLLQKNLFLPDEVSLKKRDHIRNLIYRIVGDNALKDPPASGDDVSPPGDSSNDGDNGVKFVMEINMKDFCTDLKFDSSDDQDIHATTPLRTSINWVQSSTGMLESRNDADYKSSNMLQPYERASDNQFGDMMLREEEEVFATPATYQSRNRAVSPEASDGDSPSSSPFLLSNSRVADMNIECRPSPPSTVSPIIIDDEDNFLDTKFSSNDKKEHEHSSISSDDITAFVVEDSEDENVVQSTSRIRREPLSVASASLHLSPRSYAPFREKERKGKKRYI